MDPTQPTDPAARPAEPRTVVPFARPPIGEDIEERDPGGIGSASRSCLVVLTLLVAVVLLVCLSWVGRLVF